MRQGKCQHDRLRTEEDVLVMQSLPYSVAIGHTRHRISRQGRISTVTTYLETLLLHTGAAICFFSFTVCYSSATPALADSRPEFCLVRDSSLHFCVTTFANTLLSVDRSIEHYFSGLNWFFFSRSAVQHPSTKSLSLDRLVVNCCGDQSPR